MNQGGTFLTGLASEIYLMPDKACTSVCRLASNLCFSDCFYQFSSYTIACWLLPLSLLLTSGRYTRFVPAMLVALAVIIYCYRKIYTTTKDAMFTVNQQPMRRASHQQLEQRPPPSPSTV